MVSKAQIEKAITEAYKYSSFDYLGVCDGGDDGQVVYLQVYSNKPIGKGRTYAFYGYDRYKVGEVDGQVVYDSKDEESWSQMYFDKASAVEFAREIIREI